MGKFKEKKKKKCLSAIIGIDFPVKRYSWTNVPISCDETRLNWIEVFFSLLNERTGTWQQDEEGPEKYGKNPEIPFFMFDFEASFLSSIMALYPGACILLEKSCNSEPSLVLECNILQKYIYIFSVFLAFLCIRD